MADFMEIGTRIRVEGFLAEVTEIRATGVIAEAVDGGSSLPFFVPWAEVHAPWCRDARCGGNKVAPR